MATDALSGMRRCLPALQAPYFHMASLSIVLLLMLLCAGCASDEEAEAPVPPQGRGEHRAGGYHHFSRLLSASDVCAHDRAGDGPGPERHYQYNS